MAETIRSTTDLRFGGTSAPVSPAGRREEGAGRALAEVKEMGSEAVAAVRDSANSLFEEQRNRAANEIAALGKALRHSAQSLDQNGGTVARYADDAARQIGDFAEKLRHRSWNEMTADVEDFARRWPTAFMAAAFGIGFVAGRFLMSSSAHSTSPGAATGSALGAGPAVVPRTGMARDTGTATGAASGTGQSGYGATASREIGCWPSTPTGRR